MDQHLALQLLTGMERIRRVEQGIAARYSQGKMRCPTHLSIGQEAAAMAVGRSLDNGDLAISTHRAHAHYLAKGGNLNAMIAEIYGKVTGCCRGRGGSMHLTDAMAGFVGSTAIVGNSLPIGVGLALAQQLKKSNKISAIFFGDGCTEEGVFYESVNFAIVRKLPVLFVCENNLYSVYSPLKVRQPESREIHQMAAALGLPSAVADGNDVEAAFDAVQFALRHIRSGLGPFFIELTTYRWLEHCGPNFDNHIGYRSEEEFKTWAAKDPIATYSKILLSRGWITPAALDEMRLSIDAEVLSAFEFAESSAFPLAEEAFSGLYAESAAA
jgi:TPP-dependent pyruvate/acetoin dehydrogenase alpha subunit